ncbi:MAG: helix-turn-helix domain-containing protein [Clostridia bacterium]|nr:helix-turn-helix domain-containing protein [Clostridia bacterium]
MLDYGEAFREQRELKGISRVELSKQIGTSHQNISRWESNKVLPNIDFCVQLADFYGISLDELVGREFVPNGQAKNQQ